MKDRFIYVAIFFSFATLSFLGCENEYPPSIWNPEFQGKPDPVITSVDPPDVAFAGIGVLTITGQNFSPTPEENHVYFNGVEGTILSASATELQVRAPNVPGDSIMIKLRVDGAILFAEYSPYRLDLAAIDWGGLGKFDDAYGIAVDKEENVYVSLKGKKIIKITTDGEQQPFATTLVDKASNMRFGPDGYLYYGNILQFVFRVAPDGSKDELFARLSGGVFDLDFDQHGNLYAAGGGNKIFRIKSDGSNTIAAEYPSIFIKAVRVFNGYVYVGGKNSSTAEQAVWRNQIISADELGPNELYFDWTQAFGAGADVLSLTFAEDGDMYIGTDAPEGIMVVHPDGSSEPLYPGVLLPETYAMSWGNGQYLYVNRRNSDPDIKGIIRIDMLKKGAPYYGRQ